MSVFLPAEQAETRAAHLLQTQEAPHALVHRTATPPAGGAPAPNPRVFPSLHPEPAGPAPLPGAGRAPAR
jgi:hypothetical protein